MRTPQMVAPGKMGARRDDERKSPNRPLRPVRPIRPIASELNLSGQHVDAIDQSHERCVALGVSPIERPDHTPLARSDLVVVKDRNRRLHDQAAPVMEMLYEQITNSQSMVVLTDATGVILHSIGDDDFLARASKVALRPGAVWSETAKGTNAIGTALVEETPTLVHADEHYVHANHFLTCSAAPILDPRGNILGVLDVSGDHRGYHQHTMALVKMSARMIENGWLSDDYRNVMRLHFHSRVEFIGTLMEGILAVAADGKIVGANRGALEQLGLSSAALRMHSIVSLFDTSVNALVDRFRSPLATPAPMHMGNGRLMHAVARFNWPVWASLSEALAATAPGAAPASPERTGPAAPPLTHPAGAAGHAAQTVTSGLAGATDAVASPSPAAAAPASALGHLRTGDAQMDAVVHKVQRVLNRDIPVLLLGETGTGKGLLARAMHADSQRHKQPFVAVNCASIPPTQIEAELFGCEADTFASARHKAAPGKIVQAHGGTLFLDEIGDLPVTLQAQLLRVLQERQVTPLGSQQSVAVDVAIICATQHNLSDRVEQKLFREDLFYLLNGLAVRLPALRERSDLPALVRRILEGQGAGQRWQLSADVSALLQHSPWPGNVRQLFNVLRTACAMAASERTITREHLSDDFLADTLGHQAAARQRQAESAAPTSAIKAAPVVVQRLQDMETEAIRQAVEVAGGNISEASKRLGISRNTIYRKLRWLPQPP